MKKLICAISVGISFVAFSAVADAHGVSRRQVTRAEASYGTPTYGLWNQSVPWGAYVTNVWYGSGNRRCSSRLVQLPNRWWRPLIQCE